MLKNCSYKNENQFVSDGVQLTFSVDGMAARFSATSSDSACDCFLR